MKKHLAMIAVVAALLIISSAAYLASTHSLALFQSVIVKP